MALKNRKTLTSRLTNKYLLIIRNEEDFAEKSTLTFTYARLFVLLFVVFTILFGVNLYLVNTILSQWFNPRHEQLETNKRLVELVIKLDSLEQQVNIKDQYLMNIGMILAGDDSVYAKTARNPDQIPTGSDKNLPKDYMQIDSQFRQQFELGEQSLFTAEKYGADISELYLFTPVSGIISSKFDPDIQHYGVDVVARENEPIKSVADGTVVFSSWTQDGGYVIGVQHRSNLISVYKHNSFLLKKTGSFVRSGEVIAIIGNTGELTTGSHLHFELWYNGNPVNPEDFVSF